ncbi:MAG: ABC transporter ATP-binding protein [Gulosibacter sp.]|uniref:ABC transporter ATP-binding protein n=1 Tax=Gulosibacter sp. TaxID=2817531 RepID=UPI003F8F676C
MNPDTTKPETTNTTPQPALELRAVGIAFEDEYEWIKDANLRVEDGEVVALLGPSGSGKSTLLRGIAGLETQTSGEMWMRGRLVNDVPTHQRDCGMVFQDGQLFPHRNVARNIAYGLESARWPRAKITKRVDAMLELVGLEGFGDRAVQTLSGGQAQRVALARSLATRPQLLLLDEPLSALDRELRERLAGDLRRILTRTGTSAVHVTHDEDEAATIADRTVFIHEGRLVTSRS